MLDGIVVHCGDDVVIVRRIDAFEDDGIAVVPFERIEFIESGKSQSIFRKVMMNSVDSRGYRARGWISQCKNLVSFILTAVRSKYWIGIHAYDPVHRIAIYRVGKMTNFGGDMIYVESYRSDGVRNPMMTIMIENVLRVDVGTRYVYRFGRFIEGRKKNS